MSNKWPHIACDNRTRIVIAGVFVILWLLARAYNIYPNLYPQDGTPRLSGADSYFHLRHSEAVLNHYPSVERIDTMSAYPGEERGLNQGFYDVLVATVSKVTFGLISPFQTMMWGAPVVTALAFLLLAWVLSERVTPWAGLLFLLMILAYPGPLTQLAAVGNGDHHAFEVLLATVLYLSLSKALSPSVSVGWVVLPTLFLFLFFLSWAGSPLHLFFVGLIFYVAAFPTLTPEQGKALCQKGMVLGLATFSLCFLTTMLVPDYILWDKARDVFLAAGLLLGFGYPILVNLAQRLAPKARWPVGLGLLLLVPLGAKLSVEATEAFHLFFEPRSTAIAEHQEVTLTYLFRWYGLNWIAVVIAPFVLWRQRRLRSWLVCLVGGLGLIAFIIQTRDFNYYAAPVIAIFAAYTLSQLPWKKWVPILCLSLAGINLLPLEHHNSPWLDPMLARSTVIYTDGTGEAADWLAAFRQEVGKEQVYGLVAPWDLGNILARESQTPVGWSQTHSHTLAKIFYFEDTEAVYEQLTSGERPFRFILIPTRNLEDKFGTELQLAGRNPGEVFDRGPEIEWKGKTLTLLTPNAGFKATLLSRLFDGLASDMGHYRLVFESEQKMIRAIRLKSELTKFEFAALEVSDRELEAVKPALRLRNQVVETSRGLLVNPSVSPDVRIFEMVPGAVVVGQATPHSRVGAYLGLTSPNSPSEPRLVTWKTHADSAGRFELRLPYPTGGPIYPVADTVSVSDVYKVEVDGKTHDLKITEAQIQAGAEVPLRP